MNQSQAKGVNAGDRVHGRNAGCRLGGVGLVKRARQQPTRYIRTTTEKILCCLRGSIVFHTDKGDVGLKASDRIVLEAGTPHAATVGVEGTRCAEAHVPV